MEQAIFPLTDLVFVPRPRPKTVLMTADTVGGIWTYALELARGLGKQQVHVALATMGTPMNKTQCEQVNGIPNVEVYETTFKLEWMQDPWKEVDLAGKWLLELEEVLHPDIVHLNGYAHGALPWHAPALVVGHSCVLSWWSSVRGEAAPGQWCTYRRRTKKGLESADLVVAPSKSMAAMLNQNYGPLDVRVIPNGRDPALFEPGDKEPLVFTVGRVWDEAKNIAALEDIAPKLEWPVYVAGDPNHPDGGAVEPENVCHLGIVPTDVLSNWYARAAIFALPARYEPFGLSILEAGLAGCALVLGDIASLCENWEGAAIFVPPNDPEALRLALDDLIHDPERREALGTCARARALQFTQDKMAAGYLAAYADLMAATAYRN